jgi:putative SOS response-associated peptidase YedK
VCGRFNLTAPGEEIAEAFGLDEVPDLAPRYNIAPSQPIAVVRFGPADQKRRLALWKWGLVPQGSLEGERGFINARAETAWEKPSFRDAFARRRCLIPATGFYEWQRAGTAGPGAPGRARARRQPWHFGLVGGRAFGFASLWEPPIADDAAATCTILTTEPNDIARPVHDRMPVILDPAAYARWLDPSVRAYAALAPLLRPFPAGAMHAFPVSTAVNDPRCDLPVCVQPA